LFQDIVRRCSHVFFRVIASNLLKRLDGRLDLAILLRNCSERLDCVDSPLARFVKVIRRDPLVAGGGC
jgi:hypothetical protein